MAFQKFVLLILVVACAIVDTMGELSMNYYTYSCPKMLPMIHEGVVKAMRKEARTGSSLLRLHFHDCFVNGCDGSILLDDNETFVGEKTARANIDSIRGYYVIDDLKGMVENQCPGVVSCADIVALAARESVAYLGGPFWDVRLGRRDSLTAYKDLADTFIPPPTSDLPSLALSFARHELSFKDMVALSGAHTIGFSRCMSFRDHIYNDSKVDPFFANKMKKICPEKGKDNVLASLDSRNPYHFDNFYYKNLVIKRGLLHSDQVLFNGSPADFLVQTYANDPSSFFNDFSEAMMKMSNIKPLTGNQGEVRKNCRKSN